MRDHIKLRAYKLAERLRQRLRPPANEIAVLIYELTRSFPKDEKYGLPSQMRRSAVSVPSNIVEGCAERFNSSITKTLKVYSLQHK